MPYILKEERPLKDKIIDELFVQCESKGDINYCITRLVHLWAIEQMKKIKSLTKKYDILNDAYGIMCSAAAEFYAAVVLPYERLKRKQNGPVSQLDATDDGRLKVKWECKKCGRIFTDDEVVEVIGSEISYYQCPKCGADSKDWVQDLQFT